ncbi:hypothetical protein G5V59_00180 [Nocardioides sp. W3-2-3]|uniref:hypothetical protein n=1 Tax=Nocardioides convexus TaxID=2712224 RepID=UPI0024184271|nr:hypothetical protein [Nocardioides convexus]NGZ99390.1 hypothetical protein [Nocardioides convexus]
MLQEIEWGPYLTDDAGRVVQQELTLTLLQYETPTLLQGPAKKVRSANPPKASSTKGGKGKGKGGKGGKGKGGRTKKRKRK